MKRLFLHIGFFKTGTTSIQACLSANSKRLLKRGIFYPTDPRASFVQKRKHSPLVAALPGMKPNRLDPEKSRTYKTAYDDLLETLEETEFDTLVLSDEGFGGPKVAREQMEWLQQKFSDYEIKVIVYIRPQDAYLTSVYQQKTKGVFSKRFEFSMHEDMPGLRFASRLKPWRDAFGTENVVVRPFTPSLWHEGELFYDFLHALGLRNDGLKLVTATNEGLDHRAVELLRELNSIASFDFQTRKLRNRVASNLQDFMKSVFTKKKMVLSSEQSNLLRDYYRSENEAALEGTGINADDFFPPPPQGRDACLPPESLPQDLLLRVIAGLALEKKRLGNKDLSK